MASYSISAPQFPHMKKGQARPEEAFIQGPSGRGDTRGSPPPLPPNTCCADTRGRLRTRREALSTPGSGHVLDDHDGAREGHGLRGHAWPPPSCPHLPLPGPDTRQERHTPQGRPWPLPGPTGTQGRGRGPLSSRHHLLASSQALVRGSSRDSPVTTGPRVSVHGGPADPRQSHMPTIQRFPVTSLSLC